ncbi:MAG: SDR family NAD(P)-dependent oxidoreductase, partial [Planctomycetota bacterium]
CTAEAAVAVQAIHAVCGLPVLVSRPFVGDDEADILEFVAAMTEAGVAALGVNCVSGLRGLLPIVRRLVAASPVPVLVNPNAGFPRREESRLYYQLDSDYFVRMARSYAAAGAQLIGGCCGIGPTHIRALAQAAPGMGIGTEAVAATAGSTPAQAAPARVAPHPFITGLHGTDFPTMGLLIGHGDAARERGALCELAGAGAAAGGVLASPAALRSPAMTIARLRKLQDACGMAAVLSLTAGECTLQQAQELLLGAQLLDMRLLLIDTGVFSHAGAGGRGAADCDQLLDLVARLNAGRDLSGNRLAEPAGFHVGVRIGPDQADRALELTRAGADFISLQPIYEPAVFRAIVARIGDAVPLVAEVLVLPDVVTADAVDNELPALSVPQRLKDLLAADPEEDIRGVLRFLRHWRSRLGGCCLLLPDTQTAAARQVLQGRPCHVFITGISDGIGLACAELAWSRGWRVSGCARRAARLQELARDERWCTAVADVTDEAVLRAAVVTAVAAHGPIDIVIANAGRGLHGPLAELSAGQLQDCWSVDCGGVHNTLRAVLPHMDAGGCIQIVSSIVALLPVPLMGGYVAAKHAVEALAAVARMELAGRGLRVCTVCPATVDTGFAAAAHVAGPAWTYRPGRPLRAERLAGAMLRQAQRGRPRRLILPWRARLAVAAWRLLPELYEWWLRRHLGSG